MGYQVPPAPPDQRQLLMRRLVGLVVLMAIIIVFALLVVYGFALNTIVDGNIPIGNLPLAAQNAFNGMIGYQLTTYGFLIIAVFVLAVCGTVAAIFNGSDNSDVQEEF